MATDRVIKEKKKRCCHFFSAVFYLIHFILAGNDDMHESSEVFENRSDLTTACRVSSPERVKKIPIAWMISKFGQI